MSRLKLLSGVWKTVIMLAVGVLVMVVVIAWLAGLFYQKIPPGEAAAADQPAPAADRRWDQVHKVRKVYYEEIVGTLKAASRTEVASRVLAPIEKIYVSAGQTVREGDKLIELDRRALETQLSQAKARLVAAEADLKNAEADLRRLEPLVEKQAISQQELDKARTRREVALAQLQHAQQAEAEVRVMLSYATITAPKAGMVVDTLAKEGDMARPGVPLLVLYDPASLRLEVPVPEHLAVRLKKGQTLSVRIDALQKEVESVVDEIVPQAELASRSFLVKVRLPRSEELFEGMSGRLLVPTGERDHLCLNMQALYRIGQLEFVDVLHEDGRVERRFVKTGRIGMPGRIEVLSGLREGEKVLLRATSTAPSTTLEPAF
ncbi:MAG: efflux RND transporter periplasmic adaptor subunit [Thermoguttaceae bacterium]|nr:efflux RND transporter periplasmic adaptor subunit [Thermoguttaceae bacterium]